MKRVLLGLTAATLLSLAPAQAAPILYQVQGTYDAGLADTDHNLSITVDGTANQLVYAGGVLSGGPGVTVVANTATNYSFNFLNTVNSTPTATVALNDSVDSISGTSSPNSLSLQQFTINNGAPFSFSGGASGGTNTWTMSFTGTALVPEINSSAATLPLMCAAILLGLSRRARQSRRA